jgi:hypothetical protein
MRTNDICLHRLDHLVKRVVLTVDR